MGDASYQALITHHKCSQIPAYFGRFLNKLHFLKIES
jgi:hypothetical protein